MGAAPSASSAPAHLSLHARDVVTAIRCKALPCNSSRATLTSREGGLRSRGLMRTRALWSPTTAHAGAEGVLGHFSPSTGEVAGPPTTAD